jgi:hypothetical protein
MVAPLVPLAEGCLFVCVYEPRGAIARALGLNGEMCGKGGLAAAALLGRDNDCFHENRSS